MSTTKASFLDLKIVELLKGVGHPNPMKHRFFSGKKKEHRKGVEWLDGAKYNLHQQRKQERILITNEKMMEVIGKIETPDPDYI